MFYAQPNDLYCGCFRSYGFENLKSLKLISKITSLSQKSVRCTGIESTLMIVLNKFIQDDKSLIYNQK